MSPRLSAILLLGVLSHVPAVSQEGTDIRVFRAINSQQDSAEAGFFEYLDHTSLPSFGAVPFGFIVVGALSDDRAAVEAGVLSAFSQLTALGITVGLKELVGRKRPFAELPNVKVKHEWSAAGASFPSGHTSQAFALATALSLRYRLTALTIPLIAWATAIGYGRIYLGVHYPTDVLAGAVIGVGSAAVIWALRSNFASLTESLAPEQPPASPSAQARFTLVILRVPVSL